MNVLKHAAPRAGPQLTPTLAPRAGPQPIPTLAPRAGPQLTPRLALRAGPQLDLRVVILLNKCTAWAFHASLQKPTWEPRVAT